MIIVTGGYYFYFLEILLNDLKLDQNTKNKPVFFLSAHLLLV